jgi:hypothetical protein
MSNTLILTKGDMAGPSGFYVFETGEYAPTDLVPCTKDINSEVAEVSFQANYIVNGEHI